ncbi:MAG: EamA family transporter [Clostridia bacterium]|nr:EamA family transporter [Clostridia bacterium]
MEYLLLLIACTFFSLQFIFQKLFKSRTIGGLTVCFWNLTICSAVSIMFLLIKSGLPREFNLTAFLWIVLYSASGIVCSLASITAMGCGKVSTVSTYCLIGGVIIPFLFGIGVLGESAGVMKWLAIVVLCLSLLPSFLKKETNGIAETNKPKFALCCILVFLTNGLVSVFSKLHQISPGAIDEDSFILIGAMLRCAAALLILTAFALLRRSKGEKGAFRAVFWEIGTRPMTPKQFILLILFAGTYAVCNTLGNLFSLRCMVTMDASIQFPLISGVTIILSAVLGRVCFREKISRDTWVSLILSMAGIVLFMFS